MISILPYSYIAIEGNIGAGKTSLAQIFSKRFNTGLLLEEFAENTFLPQFYENPDRFAFPLEMSFLAERYNQLKQFQENNVEKGIPLISDYIFEKSLLFARINLSRHELDLFKRFYEMIAPTLKQPDLILYLRKKTDTLMSNISKRGRDYEKTIPQAYLEKVSAEYIRHLESQKNSRVLIIESDKIDFVENPRHLLFIAELMLQNHALGIHYIQPDISY